MADEKTKDDKTSEQRTLQQKMLEQKEHVSAIVKENYQKIEDKDQKLSYRTRAMVHMAAMGFSRKEISAHFGINPSRVSAVLGSASAKREILRLQDEMFFKNPQRMFMAEVPKAFRQVKKLLHGKQTKDAVKLQAANTVFDRALGKPVQEIKHEGNAIRELFLAMDKRSAGVETVRSGVVDAEFTEVSVETKKSDDPMDNWLDENL